MYFDRQFNIKTTFPLCVFLLCGSSVVGDDIEQVGVEVLDKQGEGESL